MTLPKYLDCCSSHVCVFSGAPVSPAIKSILVRLINSGGAAKSALTQIEASIWPWNFIVKSG